MGLNTEWCVWLIHGICFFHEWQDTAHVPVREIYQTNVASENMEQCYEKLWLECAHLQDLHECKQGFAVDGSYFRCRGLPKAWTSKGENRVRILERRDERDRVYWVQNRAFTVDENGWALETFAIWSEKWWGEWTMDGRKVTRSNSVGGWSTDNSIYYDSRFKDAIVRASHVISGLYRNCDLATNQVVCADDLVVMFKIANIL